MEQLDLFAPPADPYPGIVGQAREWLIKHNARRGENGWIAG